MNINRSNERTWFSLKKKKQEVDISQKLLQMLTTQMILCFLVNTLVQVESLLHGLEQATNGNIDKIVCVF